jgi:hypothetical protein
VVELPQRLFRLSIDFRPLRIAEVLGVLVGRPCACARRVLAPGRLRSRQIALPYRLEVRVKLRYVCPLRQSAAMARMLPTSNVSYNAVRLFEKLIQVLCTKHVGLDRPPIVLCQHLIEDGRDVHGVVLHFGLAGQMTMLPRPARLAPPIDCQPWHPFSHPPILPLCPLHVTPASMSGRLPSIGFSHQTCFQFCGSARQSSKATTQVTQNATLERAMRSTCAEVYSE